MSRNFRQIRRFRQICRLPRGALSQLICFCQTLWQIFAKFAIFATFTRALLASSFAFVRTFRTIWPNSPFSPNLPYSPLSPKALIKVCQICHFRHCMASFAKFTIFATFAKSLGKILSNSPFSRLRAFLDISGVSLKVVDSSSGTVRRRHHDCESGYFSMRMLILKKILTNHNRRRQIEDIYLSKNSIVIGKRRLRELEKTSRCFGTLSFLLRTSESRCSD